MSEETKRGIKEGISFGLIAGVIFAIIQIITAAMAGYEAFAPLRSAASILLGSSALEEAEGGSAVLGLVVHLALSAAFGLIYGLVNVQFSTRTQTNWGSQVGLGLAFGFVLWFVNLQIIARLFYPWFLEPNQFAQMLMHALFFGLPLSVMYAGAERRVHHIPSHA